jgi:uncharacterized protein
VRIGVISDTHIPDKCEHIPVAVLDAFKHVDMVMHAGDIVTLKVIEELSSVCPRIVAVAGNMDRSEILKKYSVKQVFNISGVKIGLAHGAGAPLNLIELLKSTFKADNCDIIIFGHSHKPMNEKIGKTLFFNPGSATDFLSGDTSYGIIEIKDRPEGSASASNSRSHQTEGSGSASNSRSHRIKANIIKI